MSVLQDVFRGTRRALRLSSPLPRGDADDFGRIAQELHHALARLAVDREPRRATIVVGLRGGRDGCDGGGDESGGKRQFLPVRRRPCTALRRRHGNKRRRRRTETPPGLRPGEEEGGSGTEKRTEKLTISMVVGGEPNGRV